MRSFSAATRPSLWLCVSSVVLLVAAEAAQGRSSSGSVIAWGCGNGNDWGQCSVPSGLSDVTAIAAGGFHSLALKNNGSVVAWGCGDGTDVGQCRVPNGLSGVTSIAAGLLDSLAVKNDGAVVAWGCVGADYGQCSVPTDLSGVTGVAAGDYHSLALKSDGSVVAWGCSANLGVDYGQCGVPSGLSGVTAVAAGTFHSLALKNDGTVVAWGCANGGDFGQCSVPSGLSDVTAIAAGDAQSLAVKADGTVVAWGCGGGPGIDVGQCDVPVGLSDVTSVDGGTFHSLALTSGGTVEGWGCEDGAELGQCKGPILGDVTAISAGRSNSLAIGVITDHAPDCSGVLATPGVITPPTSHQFKLIALSGATDPDFDPLSYRIDGVTQDEPVKGLGDGTSPDAALTPAGAHSNQVLVRAERNPMQNGRVYRLAYTVSDGKGGTCSGTAGPSGNTTAKVEVQPKQGTPAIDDGNTTSWDSFTGAPA
jgi:Regulator of chromosome condensation (RCC1) repeat